MNILQRLITEINNIITEPYSEWKIGITDGKLNDEHCTSTIVFNPEDNSAVMQAYDVFTAKGVTAIPAIGTTPKYLYLYKSTWSKFQQDLF